jgi:hypothetical protein
MDTLRCLLALAVAVVIVFGVGVVFSRRKSDG